MISKTRSGRSLMRKALVAPVVLAVTLGVACNKDQTAYALDQAKLQKEKQDRLDAIKLESRPARVMLDFAADSNGVKAKQRLELQLDSVKLDYKKTPPPPPPPPVKDGESGKIGMVIVSDEANAPK